MGRFNPKSLFYADCESTGLNPWLGDMPFAVSLADEEGNTQYFEWPVCPKTRRVFPNEKDLEYLRRLLTSGLRKGFYNLPFDYHMLQTVGIEVAPPFHDVYSKVCCFATQEMSYRLKYLAERFCGIKNEDEKALKDETRRCRIRAKKLGWKIAEDSEADYWLPRAFDPSNNLCEVYAVQDAVRTLYLDYFSDEVISGDEDLEPIVKKEIEGLLPIILEMENLGVRFHRDINTRELEASSVKLARETEALQRVAREHGWNRTITKGKRSPQTLPIEFNPGSPYHLREILYERIGLEVARYTKKSQEPGTDWKALRPYMGHPFVRQLMAFRSARKAVVDYFGKYDRMMREEPCREAGDAGEAESGKIWVIHPTFNQMGAKATGRLSSRDPNAQNVASAESSARSQEPINAREPWGPRPGHRWYCFDFAQQETRIYADIANDEDMIPVFLEGRDINTENANKAWGGRGNPHAVTSACFSLELGSPTPESEDIKRVWSELGWSTFLAAKYGLLHDRSREVAERWLERYSWDIVAAEKSIGKKSTRTRAKNLFFAKIYGGGWSAVVDMLFCTPQEAQEFLNRYDEVFPAIRRYQGQSSYIAKAQGYIVTVYGRRLLVERGYEYRAGNYFIQSAAADMCKDSMIRIRNFIRKNCLCDRAKIILQVHDEIILEIKNGYDYPWLLRGVRNIMQDNRGRIKRVPMIVDAGMCKRTWNEKEPVEL